MLTLGEIIINIKQRLSGKYDGFESHMNDVNRAKHIQCAMEFIETGNIPDSRIGFFNKVLRYYVESPNSVFPGKELTRDDQQNIHLLARIAMLGEVYEVCLKHPELIDNDFIVRLIGATQLQQQFLSSDFAKGQLSEEVIQELKMLNHRLEQQDFYEEHTSDVIGMSRHSNQFTKGALIVFAAIILLMNTYNLLKGEKPTSLSNTLNIIAYAFLAGLWRLTKLVDKDIQLTQQAREHGLNFFQQQRDRKRELEAQSQPWKQEDVEKLVKVMFISPEKIKMLSTLEQTRLQKKMR